jgi:hypothetical protein
VLAFWDYNGNGSLDEGEPPLEGILNRIGIGECTTRMDGLCTLVGVPKGNQTIKVSATPNLKYILPSAQDEIPIEKGLPIFISNNESVVIPLTEGRFVLPFPADTKYNIGTWYDKSPEVGKGSNWLGETTTTFSTYDDSLYSKTFRILNNHYNGIDYLFPTAQYRSQF